MNILSYINVAKLCNGIYNISELNHNVVKEGINYPLLYILRAIKWRKILSCYKHMWTKFIRERIITSKLIKYISEETLYLLEKMK